MDIGKKHMGTETNFIVGKRFREILVDVFCCWAEISDGCSIDNNWEFLLKKPA